VPTIRDNTQIAGGASIANLIAGSKFEFMPRAMAIAIYSVEDNATAAGDVTMDVTFGNAVEGDSLAVPTFTANLGPDKDKHLIASGIAAAGDRLQLKVNNAGVAAANLRTLIDLRPI
jgi:hypothetical protein